MVLEVDKKSTMYKSALEGVRHWQGIMDILIRRGDEAEKKMTASKPIASLSKASVADELKKLVELRDSGTLTADEFQQQKSLVLNPAL
jgi:hypothetical protein